MNGEEPLAHHATIGEPWTSSSATRCGPKHTINEDSYLDLPELGLFVVADGIGGHSDGGLASRAVVEIIDRTAHEATDLETRVAVIEQALQSINAALWRSAQDQEEGTIIGSTVAVLLVADGYAVCLWAGDSRIYLNRDAQLYQLTRDHNLATDFGLPEAEGAALTRAVGSAPELELERVVTALEPGDVLLVCSDGVTKVLDDRSLAAVLQLEPVEGLAVRLVASVAEQGGRDDITAISVRYDGD